MARDDMNPIEREELTLTAIAREELERANSDAEKATEALTSRLLADTSLIQTSFESWVGSVAKARVAGLLSTRRHDIEAAHSATARGEALARVAGRELQRCMDIPIYGGKRLGDATIAEVRASAAEYAKLAETSGRRARFQMAVVAAAEEKSKDPGQPIKKVLTEKQIATLLEEASGE